MYFANIFSSHSLSMGFHRAEDFTFNGLQFINFFSFTDHILGIVSKKSFPGSSTLVLSRTTSLVVQWLRLPSPNAQSLGSVPGEGIGSHMPQIRQSNN